MLRLIAFLCLVFGVAASLPEPASADGRVALVIGNGAYQNVSPLANPTNDAADMAETLTALGFDVRHVSDLGKAEMEAELADFADASAGADIAIVFYAGHGMEVDRQNYLIPVDAQLETDRRLRFETISLDDVLVSVEAVSGVRIILLDACRNNPFAASMQVASASRSIGRGLSRVEAPSGTVVSFAAKEGSVADDGDGRNSPFTSALLDNLDEPGLEIGFLFRKVRDSVLSATDGAQEPYISASLPGDAIFIVPPGTEPTPPAGPIVTPSPDATPSQQPPQVAGGPTPPAGAVDNRAPLRPGEAVVTRSAAIGGDIDPDAPVASIIDLTSPGTQPRGQRLSDTLPRASVTAREVGHVFGTAIDDVGGKSDIYLAASPAFGLHRTPDNAAWAEGMWGEGGGPGSIYVLRADNDYAPELFADISLDGRANTGAGLGNIAIDRRHRQLFVTDLETGMIHRLRLADGSAIDYFDHGTEARTGFFDAISGTSMSLPPVGFDPASAAQIDDCPAGLFSESPACWNLADFRRRVWGIGVRNDTVGGTTRLYYSVWGSSAFGSPDWAGAGDDQRNAIWSIGITPDGGFDRADIRREFYLPDYFTRPENFQVYGPSHPAADLSFSACGAQDRMLVAERGGIQSLDPEAGAPYARAHESRVLRYEIGPDGVWRPGGRYDAGFYDRADDGIPYIRSNALGGASFGPGYDGTWNTAPDFRNAFVWVSADALCSERGACFAPGADSHTDTSLAHGLQGASAELVSAIMPDEAFEDYPASGAATLAGAPGNAFMVALAGSTGEGGPYSSGASLIGDITIHQPCPEGEYGGEGLLPPEYDVADVPPGEAWPEDYYPDEPFPEGDYPDPDPGDYPPDPGGWGGWEPGYDLAIAKYGPDECQEGAVCPWQLAVTNNGPDHYFGKIAVRDEMPPGATFVSSSPGWICSSFFGAVSCMRAGAVALAPGATLAVDVNVRLPFNVPGNAVQNCGRIDWDEIGHDDGAGDANDLACIVTPVLDHFDLGIAKSNQLPSCGAGAECPSVVEMTNAGPGEFSGKLAFAETLPADTTLASVSGAWGCSQSGQELFCSRQATLGVGDTVSATLRLVYPLSTPDGALQNCARIDFPAMNATDGFFDLAPDVACDTVDIHHDGFDLAISKIGPAACNGGDQCEYGIEFENNGPNSFNARLAFIDDRPAGSSIASGPGVGWVCLPTGAPDQVACETAAAVALAPGASQETSLTYQLPALVGEESVTTCSSLDWGVMPLDLPGDVNDEDCATTLVGSGFDLVAGKTGGDECVEGTICPYELTALNGGDKAFEGILSLTDELPDGASIVSASAGWTCGPAGASNVATCHTNEETTVLVDATATLELGVQLPDDIIVDTIENCTTLDLEGMGYSGDGDDTNNGPACATTGVLEADIALFSGTTCEASESEDLPCNLGVSYMNGGGKAFQGNFALRGELDPAIEIQTIIPPGEGWVCEILGAGSYLCGLTNAIRLEPGDAQKLRLVATIPAGYSQSTLLHRSWVVWPEASGRDSNAGNDANLSVVRILHHEEEEPEAEPEPQPQPEPEPEPEVAPSPELSITKTGPREWQFGEDATWSMAIGNNGPGHYAGILFVDDILPEGGGITLRSASEGWQCDQDSGTVGCRRGFTELAPGQSVRLDLRLRLSEESSIGGGRVGQYPAENCAVIGRPVGSLAHGLTSQRGAVYAIQNALAIEGYLPRTDIDGLFGNQSSAALERYQGDHGLTRTGRPDTETVQSLMPLINSIAGDANRGNDRHCARTVLVREEPPIPECPPGTTWSPERATCVSICRQDQVWTGNRCAPRCDNGEQWNGRACEPICRLDQRWTGERCVNRCGQGEQWTGQGCAPICRADQILRGGACIDRCGRGERWTDRGCVPICRSDQELRGGECVDRCGPNQTLTSQGCVPICRKDQVLRNGNCVDRCGRGQQWNGQTCVPICRDDQVLTSNGCQDRCPKGQTWNGKTCVGTCPAGQRWDGNRCVSACPSGQQFVPRLGTCIPILRLPDNVLNPQRQPQLTPQPTQPSNPQIRPNLPQLQINPQLLQQQQKQQQLQQAPQLQINPQQLQQFQLQRRVQ